MDDTFLVWPHGSERLEKFLVFLTNIHGNIKFTVVEQIKRGRGLPFLFTFVSRKGDGSLRWVSVSQTHSYRPIFEQ